jgi:hypothetical protein
MRIAADNSARMDNAMQHPFDGVILPRDSAPTATTAETSTPRRGFFQTAAAYALGLLTFGMAGSAFARDGWRYRSRNGWYRYYSPRSDSYSPPRATTYAVGEEGGGRVTTYAVGEEGSGGGGGGGTVTTYAVGEEGSSRPPGQVTTYAVGEEGSGGGRPPGQVTTYAVGEEGSGGGSRGPVTTQAIGEEGSGRSSQRSPKVPRGGV